MHTGSYKPLKINPWPSRFSSDAGLIDLYMNPASPPSRAVLMIVKELGIPVNVKIVDLLKGEQMKSCYLKINPMHCVPAIDDEGYNLFESRAIMRYLVNKYAPESNLYPKDPRKRAEVDKMLELDHGVFYAAIKDYFLPLYLTGAQPTPEKQETYTTALKLLEDFLSNRSYVAGSHLSLADISIFAGITFTEVIDYDYSDYPKIQAWMSRLKQLPYHKEINEEYMKKGFKEFVLKNINKI